MAYERSITPIGDKSQVPKVDPGFKMLPPKLGRSAGRTRTTRIPNSGEGCTKKGRKRCARCHEFGHHAKGCKEPEFDPGCMVAPPPPPRAKRRKTNSSSQPPPVNDTPPSVQEPPPPVQEHATSSQPSSMDAPPPPPRAKKMTTKGPIIVGQTSQEPATSASQPIPRRTPPRQAKERAASRVAASRAQASSRKNLLDAIINS
ncbi:hypothetical protein OsI_15274 [Oryza sativa Indica Group]|uniref:CCHC-type domain-containing protein n=1 Tax=Oryza sativa subsp. indica TaxID=39946 RepID=A2XRL3_ORYSI|nr:hypothetical protein OsI_15274 [Oryza sativa Indica Group]